MKRFYRLPDDPQEAAEALDRAKQIDPEAQLHNCPPPINPHIETSSKKAELWAMMGVSETVPQSFKLPPRQR